MTETQWKEDVQKLMALRQSGNDVKVLGSVDICMRFA